jgi:hypothetical protein
MLRTIINADRGSNYPNGVPYPAIDLAIDGQITATDLEQLDAAFFPGRHLVKK